jgi:citrate synthase
MRLVELLLIIMVIVCGYLGIKETDFYTTIFAVSRAIGCLTNGVWSRALGLPIERPNSIDMNYITKLQ